MDWDDVRVFLAVARRGSVRAAAQVLEVNHATVSRRVIRLEARLGTLLFDRSPSGYLLTANGEDLLVAAEQMEEQATGVERRLLGRDRELRGSLKVALPVSIAQVLLMDDMVAFADLYPDIEFTLLISQTVMDLSSRAADVAIRMSNEPAPSLIGRRAILLYKSIYASPEYLASRPQKEWTWIGWDDGATHPQWVRDSPLPEAPVRTRINHSMGQLAAAKSGMGITMLPCYMGDSEPELCRVTDVVPMPDRQLWLLTHEDLRQTARVQAFFDHATEAIAKKRDLIEGRCGRARPEPA
jgi:DNA-binding transcriptional LysR family regulator